MILCPLKTPSTRPCADTKEHAPNTRTTAATTIDIPLEIPEYPFMRSLLYAAGNNAVANDDGCTAQKASSKRARGAASAQSSAHRILHHPLANQRVR